MKISDIKPTKKKSGPKSLRLSRSQNIRLLVNLRAIRDKFGLSLRDVTKATGLSISTLNRTERGAEPSLEIALRIAQVYECPIEQIWSLRRKQ